MALANLAWILAQLSSGIFIGKLEIHKIYLAGFILMGVGWVFAFLNLKKIKEPKYDNLNIHKSLLKFFKNKNLIRAYAFSFLLQIFYSFMLIYTPLYLSAHLGFSWQNIGIIFTIMLIPFSIVPILFGKHVDKVGEKSALMFGFLIITISTWILFFIPKEASILIWAIALFMTRVGAALIETMSDVYFFKHIKEENEEFFVDLTLQADQNVNVLFKENRAKIVILANNSGTTQIAISNPDIFQQSPKVAKEPNPSLDWLRFFREWCWLQPIWLALRPLE
jgi:MFS family permease